MKISILTLFPNFFNDFFNTSIIKRSIQNKFVEIEIINFRDFSKDKHMKVDSSPYGGGAGMVLMLQPIVDAIKSIKTSESKVILLTPSGELYNQEFANKLSTYKHLILICGHYEGFDERILNYVDFELSIGDYILTGGEVASLAVMESIIRLVPGVISSESLSHESFNNNLLDYANYTKPYDFEGYKVPDVLLSGNHKEIEKFRLNSKIEKTKSNRSDLYNKYLKFIERNDNE